MFGKWLCDKCHSNNELNKTRCGFCGNPQPDNISTVHESQNTEAEIKLSQLLHNAIEKMTPLQRRKTQRWLEDNIF
jgi:hypothetical protein